MRGRVKSIRWRSSRPTYSVRDRSVHDGTLFRSTYGQLDRGLSWLSCHRGRRKAVYWPPTLPTGLLTSRRRFTVCTPRRSDDFDEFEDDVDPSRNSKNDISSMVRMRRDGRLPQVKPTSSPLSSQQLRQERIAEEKAKARAIQAQIEKQRQKERERLAREKREEEERLKAQLEAQLEAKRQVREVERQVREAERQILEVKRQALEAEQRIREAIEREQRQAHEQFMSQYQDLMARGARFSNVAEPFFDVLYDIKYPAHAKVESHLKELAQSFENLRYKYRESKIVFKKLGFIRRRVIIEQKINELTTWLNSTADSLDNAYVTHQASAKKNVDRQLRPFYTFFEAYTASQETAFEVRSSRELIRSTLLELADDFPRHRDFYRKFESKIYFTGQAIFEVLHEYRAYRRFSLWSAFPGSQAVRIATSLVPGHWELLGVTPRDLRSLSRKRRITTILAKWYLPRWSVHSPRSPKSDINWRFLDVMYPFDAIRYRGLAINRLTKILVLLLELRQDDSHNLNEETLLKQKHFLTEWTKELEVMMSNLETHVDQLRFITYLRLTKESKVYELGDVPDTISKGLFTPENPLSLDFRRFFLYTDSIANETYLCDRLLKELNQLKELRPKKKRNKKRNKKPTKESTKKSNSKDGSVSKRARLSSSPFTKKKERSSRALTRARRRARRLSPQSETTSTVQSPNKRGERGREVVEVRNPSNGSSLDIKSGKRKNDHARPVSAGTPTTVSTKRSRRKTHRTGSILSKREYSTISKSNLKWSGCEESSSDVNGIGVNLGPSEDQKSHMTMITACKQHDSQLEPSHTPHAQAQRPSDSEPETSKPQFWSHRHHKGPNGEKIVVHYCRSFEGAERVTRLFLDSGVIGFDIEWNVLRRVSIKDNVSVIQIANEERIAIFHIALFQRRDNPKDLVPPSLKTLLESVDTVKVGVNIKADCTRVRRHLNIEVQSQLELSHLYKLVKFSQSNPKLINRRVVNLSQQVEEILGLPLYKGDDIRCSDWTRPLSYTQIQYAASDPFACLCLYHALEAKRKALQPVPPQPAYAELNLPILPSVENSVGNSESRPINLEE